MRVGFDIDGVLHDFAESFRSWIKVCGCGHPHKYIEGEVNKWEFYLDWGMTVQDFIEHCHSGVDAGYVFRGNIRPGAVESMRKVHGLGHSIHIITDRPFGKTPKVSQMATLEWLNEHDFPFHTLDFSADKTIVPTDMFVEDKLENYDALAKAGCDVYLINRPWNTQTLPDDRKRISSALEFADIVEDKSRYVAGLTRFK